jgi:hypothetical protein
MSSSLFRLSRSPRIPSGVALPELYEDRLERIEWAPTHIPKYAAQRREAHHREASLARLQNRAVTYWHNNKRRNANWASQQRDADFQTHRGSRQGVLLDLRG